MTMWFVDDTGYDLVLTPFEEDIDEIGWTGQQEQQEIVEEMEEPHRQFMPVDKMFHSAYHEWSFKDYSR